MSKTAARKHLYDPRHGGEAIRLAAVVLGQQPTEPPRTNCFSIYWIEAGQGEFWADTARHSFAANSLLFFTPYQYIRFAPEAAVKGVVIQFHANFLCVETFHAESGCAAALFSDLYNPPVVVLDKSTGREAAAIVKRMQAEQEARSLAFDDMLLAQLKVLLILATRLKIKTAAACEANGRDLRHPVLGDLKQLIDARFAELHAPSDYAKLLHVSPKTLGRVVREQLGKSLTDLIRERILTHAKWQLLHTLKPVKEVAREVGFTDELYFSRMFKKGTGYSPTFFREFETEIRGGSNLSMVSRQAPILKQERKTNNSSN
jgi:AraC family transcriptional activator of pobA